MTNLLCTRLVSLIYERLGVSSAAHTRAFSQTSIRASPSKLRPLNAHEGSSSKDKLLGDIPNGLYSGRTRTSPPRQTSGGNGHGSQTSGGSGRGSRHKSKIEPEPPVRSRKRPPPTPHAYVAHRETIKRRFPEGWAPPRTISREAMEVLRALHARDPVQFRTPVLANKFKISPEAVARILRSKWRPPPERTAQLIARDNLARDRRIAEKIKVEQRAAAKSLEGRLDIVEKAQGKDKLTMK